MSKIFFAFLIVLALIANMLALTTAAEDNNETEATRVKRGYGGGGGGGGGGHGHGPGRGGGAAGPVYFCGYIGKTEGYGGGYGR